MKNSAERIIDQSTIPPKYPEIPPRITASIKDIAVATKPIVKEMREPYTILEKRSLPRLSAPKR